MCLKGPPNVLLAVSRQGAHCRPCHNCLIKSIKDISRHFWVQTLSVRNHTKENVRSSLLKADIALALELTWTCVHATVYTCARGVLLDGMRWLDTQLRAQAGSWKLVPPQQTGGHCHYLL